MLEPHRAGTTSHRFAFGGVAFEVEVGEGVCWRLSESFAAHALEVEGAPVAATIRCRVDLAERPLAAVPGILIADDGSTLRVTCTEVVARIAAAAATHYEAVVLAAAGDRVADAVALGVSAALLQREGGLMLHAGALALDQRAVLFIGPSGAGKSTALGLSGPASVLAYDRVAVVPCSNGQVLVWSLPGGSPVAGAWSARRVLPLAAILRVRQATGQPRIESLSGARQLFALRESVDVGDASEHGELLRMAAVSQLLQRVAVSEIHTVLGVTHQPLLRDLIDAGGPSRSSREERHVSDHL